VRFASDNVPKTNHKYVWNWLVTYIAKMKFAKGIMRIKFMDKWLNRDLKGS